RRSRRAAPAGHRSRPSAPGSAYTPAGRDVTTGALQGGDQAAVGRRDIGIAAQDAAGVYTRCFQAPVNTSSIWTGETEALGSGSGGDGSAARPCSTMAR